MENIFALKGDLAYSTDRKTIVTKKDYYLVCEKGKVCGVYEVLPSKFTNIPVREYKNALIIPGLIDLHVHAPQYSYRGLGMDLELLDWLNTNTFPEESKFKDIEYATKAYEIFVNDMKYSATTRACIFATLHVPATIRLMDLFEETGLITMVGKLNMDRNCPDYLKEATNESIEETIAWIHQTKNRYQHVSPILTPRFVPTCSDELLKQLGEIAKQMGISAQSHLSENVDEIAWVKELCKGATSYGDAYDRQGLFGIHSKTIMAHCVYSSEEEIALMKERGVFIAHCPQSNMNVASGIAPIRYFLERNLKLGLGSDIAGGSSLSIFRAMTDAIQCSKLYYRIVDESAKQLTIDEAFYLGTMGGGEFFGEVGSFLEGFSFDAIVLEDESLPHPQEFTIKQRLERLVYLSDERHICAKFVEGSCIFDTRFC